MYATFSRYTTAVEVEGQVDICPSEGELGEQNFSAGTYTYTERGGAHPQITEIVNAIPASRGPRTNNALEKNRILSPHLWLR